jgi:hypothetical protein
MTWEERAKALWQLLDDIDTADDACRGHDPAFRERTRELVKRRHAILSSDGYALSVPSAALTPELCDLEIASIQIEDDKLPAELAQAGYGAVYDQRRRLLAIATRLSRLLTERVHEEANAHQIRRIDAPYVLLGALGPTSPGKGPWTWVGPDAPVHAKRALDLMVLHGRIDRDKWEVCPAVSANESTP